MSDLVTSGHLLFLVLAAGIAVIAAFTWLGVGVTIRSIDGDRRRDAVKALDVVMTIFLVLIAILFTACSVGVANFQGVY